MTAIKNTKSIIHKSTIKFNLISIKYIAGMNKQQRRLLSKNEKTCGQVKNEFGFI